MKNLAASLIVSFTLIFAACDEPAVPRTEQEADGKPMSAPEATVADARNSFVVLNVNVFDGHEFHQNKVVAVVDGKIAAIADSANKWRGLQRVDGQGGTLLPGLMDAHTHTQSLVQLEDSLRFGVTTIFDMATAPASAEMLRAAARESNDVADFQSAIFLATVPGGHGTQYGREVPTLSSADEADKFVQARFDEGSDYLKIIVSGQRARQGLPTLDAETVTALVDAAHSRGMLAVAHIETTDDVHMVLTGGIDGLVHVWRDSGFSPKLSSLLAEKGVFVITTLVTQDGFIDAAGGSTLVADSRLRPYLSDRAVAELTTRRGGPEFSDIDRFLEAVSGLVEARVTVLVGTDVSAGTTYHGVSVHRELELLVQAGLKPIDALAAATSNVARAYGTDDRGSIAPGKRADLLLVRGDPTQEITATRDIISVWRNGVRFDRTLKEGE
jgi:imidazolonepropionase-like amidohydrolase